MDAIEAILARASCLRVVPPGPTPDQLELILKAGSRAPDHGRMQPFRFLVMEGAARERLGELMAAALARRAPDVAASALDGERAKALRAPTIVAVGAALRPNPKVPDIEQVVAAGAACQNMLLAAHALGLGAFWRTGPAAYDAGVKAGLGFDEGDAIVGFLYFGAPAGVPPERPVDVAALTRRL
jgi:nitroreductase